MNNKKEKFIFWLMGLGCGILLSGIVGTFLSLNILNNDFKLKNEMTNEHEISNNSKLNNEAINNSNELTEEEIIEKALGLGMKFEDSKEISNDENAPIKLYISSELGATEICEVLEKSKVVKDGEKFKEYIKKQDKVTSLRHGEFEFSRNMTYEEILEVLLGEK